MLRCCISGEPNLVNQFVIGNLACLLKKTKLLTFNFPQLYNIQALTKIVNFTKWQRSCWRWWPWDRYYHRHLAICIQLSITLIRQKLHWSSKNAYGIIWRKMCHPQLSTTSTVMVSDTHGGLVGVHIKLLLYCISGLHWRDSLSARPHPQFVDPLRNIMLRKLPLLGTFYHHMFVLPEVNQKENQDIIPPIEDGQGSTAL